MHENGRLSVRGKIGFNGGRWLAVSKRWDGF